MNRPLPSRALLAVTALFVSASLSARAAESDGTCEESGGVVTTILDLGRSVNAALGLLPSIQAPIPQLGLPEEVDTLVIGAGPGGGTIAAALAEGGETVALLDAGQMQTLPISQSLAAFAAATEDPHRELAYAVTRIAGQPRANYPRLDGPGASSAGAAGIMTPPFVVPLEEVCLKYDDPLWCPDSMGRYLKRVEDARYDVPGRLDDLLLGPFSRSRHGHGGFQKTGIPGPATLLAGLRDLPQLLPVYGAMFGLTRIFPHALRRFDLHDPVVQQTEGPVLLPAATMADGTRSTVAQRIQAVQAAHPDRLLVQGEVLVDRFLSEPGPDGALRATAVEYYQGANLPGASPLSDLSQPLPPKRTIHFKKLVIAGSPWGTGGVLVRSGVASEEELKAVEVPPVHVLAGVNQRVGDRLETTIRVEMPLPFHTVAKLKAAVARLQEITARVQADPTDRKAQRDFRRAWEKYRGILASNGIPLGWLIKSSPELPAPDILVTAPFPVNFTNFRKGFSKDLTASPTTLSFLMLKIDTASQGTARAVSRDPRVPLQVSVNYDLQSPYFQALARGLLQVNQVVGPRLPKGARIVAGKASTLEEAVAFLSNKDNIFGHHLWGGAAMGLPEDPLTVVNSRGQLSGYDNVWLAGTPIWDRSLGPFPIVPIETVSSMQADQILQAN